MSLRTADLPTGATLQYAERGDPAGIPVLLLHGYSDSWRSFEPLLPYLPPAWRLIIPSQRGHGDSSRPASGYRMQDFAADAVALLDALGIERTAIVGHSMGTLIGQCLGADPSRQSRITRLVLISPAANGPLRELNKLVAALTDPLDRGFVEEFQRSTVTRPISDAFIDLAVSESMKMPVTAWHAMSQGMVDLDTAGNYARIGVPTLILSGTRDEMFSDEDRSEMSRKIPDAQLTIYQQAGHALHWEEPGRVARDLEGFIGQS